MPNLRRLRPASAPVILLCSLAAASAQPVELLSPDGRLTFRFECKDQPVYQALYKGRPLILESALGLRFDGAAAMTSHLRVKSVRRSSHSSEWKPYWGERSVIPDRYNEAVIELQETIPPRRALAIVVRAFDEGIAFRYRLSGLGLMTVSGEATEFAFPTGVLAWETHGAQSTYRRVPIDEIQPNCERPLLVEYPGGVYAAVEEAALLDYSTMLLSRAPKKPGALTVSLAGQARLTPPAETPWRVVLAGDRPGDLLEHDYVLLNLCPPSRIQEVSWIQPGKVLREATLSTRGAKEAVDFAARRGISYIEFDAGWYGPEGSEASNAARVSVDPARLQKDPAYQGLDLPEAIRYAHGKNVGVLLYVNRNAAERQADEILPLYRKWGVSGVKYGFVNVGRQEWTRWLYHVVDLAAAQHLVVDIHDEFRPTGLSRTWPNLLTQEGIRGNEEMPDATHNTVMPFTRFLAGAADYTICWTNERVKNTRAHQLALSVLYYSPLQFMYWYDRPSSVNEDDPAVGFFDRVPTVWDDTRVIDGRPGEFAAIARRSGEKWFVGAITNTESRTVSIPLTFLPAGKSFEAAIYTDSDQPKQVRVEKRAVKSSDTLELRLPPSGGAAVELK